MSAECYAKKHDCFSYGFICASERENYVFEVVKGAEEVNEVECGDREFLICQCGKEMRR